MKYSYGVCLFNVLFLIVGLRIDAQAFSAGGTVVTVVGHNSSSCNAWAGDSQSMELCRLKVTISGALWKTVLLPCQMASVKEVRSVSSNTFLFLGELPGGQGEVLSAQNLSRPGSEFTLVAGTVSISPNAKMIVTKKYIPPHGGEQDSVTLTVTDLNESQPSASKSRIVLDDRRANLDGANGSILCSSSLFWSLSGEEIAACIRPLNDRSLHFILFRREGSSWMTLEQTIRSSSLCTNAAGKDQVCSVTVQKMKINEATVAIEASIQDNDGVRQKSLVLSRKEFVPF